jgi:pimeloyl-ACP methyl ester carboxylesterase
MPVTVSFHVVLPSIPGYTFSSAPPASNWTTADNARIFNTLMTKALGYDQYIVLGSDWVSQTGASPQVFSAYIQRLSSGL